MTGSKRVVAIGLGLAVAALGEAAAVAASAPEEAGGEIAERIDGPAGTDGLPEVICTAEQTGGFHDYPGAEETYEPALFHPQTFTLEENLVFMMNLASGEGNADLYLTMVRRLPPREAEGEDVRETTELECRRVRGADASVGYSCVNLPPSEMLLINAASLRFTRTAVGGWTFAGATEAHGGDSIFVEYGQCKPRGP